LAAISELHFLCAYQLFKLQYQKKRRKQAKVFNSKSKKNLRFGRNNLTTGVSQEEQKHSHSHGEAARLIKTVYQFFCDGYWLSKMSLSTKTMMRIGGTQKATTTYEVVYFSKTPCFFLTRRVKMYFLNYQDFSLLQPHSHTLSSSLSTPPSLDSDGMVSKKVNPSATTAAAKPMIRQRRRGQNL
jgi:hypothetical protein